ncbi:MAG: Mrp/NBP35 family ATP-binding protein [Bacteroidales bacterium]|nr:Mrp/NBP35 family ATP-binding protein [Bacteroidales bacterium]
MNITVEQVRAALTHVLDPDLGRDLVSLQMIDKLEVDGNKIRFEIVLTTPACPMKERMRRDCLAAIAQHVSPDAEVEIGFSARMRAPETREHEALKDVKHIIAVGSGKGGVGKSTVSANLALALAKTGAKVALVDADIYGPSVPTMFNLTHTAPRGVEADGKTYLVPMEQYGLKIMSIGFFVDPAKAVLWRGPMASNALKQMFTETLWGEIDYMVVDLPPGTGDIQITLSQMIPVSAALLVSTPQEVAVVDVRRPPICSARSRRPFWAWWRIWRTLRRPNCRTTNTIFSARAVASVWRRNSVSRFWRRYRSWLRSASRPTKVCLLCRHPIRRLPIPSRRSLRLWAGKWRANWPCSNTRNRCGSGRPDKGKRFNINIYISWKQHRKRK